MDDSVSNSDVRDVWDANAEFWDAHMGEEGNTFHRELVAPAAERLLEVQSGERVLEIACGTGLFARRMVELGARVLATDVSGVMVRMARQKFADASAPIEFRQLDAADPAQMGALPENGFDAAVCNMALFDMIEIAPLFQGLARALVPGGRFVFTICHPSFNTNASIRMVEQEDREGEILTCHSMKVTKYKGLGPARAIGIVGQPRVQHTFHRPLSNLLDPAFAAGFSLDGLLEPSFISAADSKRSLEMRNFAEFPMVLAGRLRLR
ncbi:class I SAM-dependent methyltransferase [Capsulimonas corticalis]|uniref:Class I SAM-dependent methyltransferase n=1 Tax=Capsulimonas corticalis TaxID=2219043 RepID=A0A402D0I4_9BACT|nr:class I SAM-dependent methyltransferase [Capsulimonas corticalis]BDI33594.1 class I SAM-dependent methyltransferase [Capsulimonas corticalis]